MPFLYSPAGTLVTCWCCTRAVAPGYLSHWLYFGAVVGWALLSTRTNRIAQVGAGELAGATAGIATYSRGSQEINCRLVIIMSKNFSFLTVGRVLHHCD